MASPEARCAALTAAAALTGPAIPPAVVINRPHEAATALTRMADLLLPWLEGPDAGEVAGGTQ
jgi:TRAP-type C4-dicarboxylate transport system permease large subunit